MTTKIVLCLALASLAAIQVSALPDPAIQLAITQATAAVATSGAAATSAINIALASIANASASLAASSSTASGYQTVLIPQIFSALDGLDTMIHYGIPLWGGNSKLFSICVNSQKATFIGILGQSAIGIQSCVTNIINQVTVHNANVLAQQPVVATLVASAASGFTNCTTYTGTTTDVLTCISIVVSTITNRADMIAHNVQAYAAAVDQIMPNVQANLNQCGIALWTPVFIQLVNIYNAVGLCLTQ